MSFDFKTCLSNALEYVERAKVANGTEQGIHTSLLRMKFDTMLFSTTPGIASLDTSCAK